VELAEQTVKLRHIVLYITAADPKGLLGAIPEKLRPGVTLQCPREDYFAKRRVRELNRANLCCEIDIAAQRTLAISTRKLGQDVREVMPVHSLLDGIGLFIANALIEDRGDHKRRVPCGKLPTKVLASLNSGE
jgi:hypothetical protein